MVKQGYKKTELGIIPDEWQIRSLGDLFSISAGGDVKKEHFSLEKDEKHKYPIYSNSLKENGLYGFSENYNYGPNCITVTGRGNLGIATPRDHKFDAIIRLLVLTPKEKLNIHYISEVINKKIQFKNEITSIPQLTGPQISTYSIACPEPKEQDFIAKVISDMDNLIESIEILIEKKKKIKQGAMQELLTGKKRLFGFKEKWDIIKLGELVGKITTGKLDANAMKEDGDYRFYTCAKNYYWIDEYAFDTEALLVSGNGANVGYIHYFKGKFNAYQRTYVLSNFSGNILYIKLFMDRNLQERIRVEVNAGNTPYITMDTLTDMTILIPPTEKEQLAIAEILSDMDEEINKLEQKLGKYKSIKVGLMQQLLTGRIRLKWKAN